MGFIRKIGRKIDDEIIQPIVNTVEDIVENPAALLAIGALAIGIPAIGGLVGAGGGVAAGLTAAEAAGLGLTAAEAAAAGLSAAEFAAAAGTAGAGAGLLGGAEALSALDAGMGVYPTLGISEAVGGTALSGLDAGMGAYPSTGNIGAEGLSALDAGMDVYPSTGTIGDAAATAAKFPLSASDALRLAALAAGGAGAASLAADTFGGKFDIVPIPADWASPPPTSVAEFTPLAPIDFGNPQMLQGTQWEKLLNPTYNQPVPMANPAVSTNPSNMSFEELTRILGGSKASIPTQNVSINDVIAGIQSQYGQAP
jgi:hypothetical protein